MISVLLELVLVDASEERPGLLNSMTGSLALLCGSGLWVVGCELVGSLMDERAHVGVVLV